MKLFLHTFILSFLSIAVAQSENNGLTLMISAAILIEILYLAYIGLKELKKLYE